MYLKTRRAPPEVPIKMMTNEMNCHQQNFDNSSLRSKISQPTTFCLSKCFGNPVVNQSTVRNFSESPII